MQNQTLQTNLVSIFQEIESENISLYESGLNNLLSQFQILVEEQSFKIQQYLIPKIIFSLCKFRIMKKTLILLHLQILQKFVQLEEYLNVLIENGLNSVLFQLVILEDKSIDKFIISIFLDAIRFSNKHSGQIQIFLLISFPIQKLMEMVDYQPFKTSTISKIVVLCDMKSISHYQKKRHFIAELLNVLANEPQNSEQFIKALEIISEWIYIKQVQEILILQVGLQKIFSSIPIWLERYRTALDSILVICKALVLNKQEQKLRIHILRQGLQKYLIQLINSKNFCVRDLTLQIINELAQDEVTLELLFHYQVMQELFEQFKEKPNQSRIISIFMQALENSNDQVLKQHKNIFEYFLYILKKQNLDIKQ